MSKSLILNTGSIRRFYLAIAMGCGLFVILTVIAMFTYTGGWVDDHTAPGYSFTHNFLSNLGMLTSLSGELNSISAVLFFIALSLAGASLVVFFALFPAFFRSNRLQRFFAYAGSTLGILAGISFIGIAFSPADIALSLHMQFVMWAFRLFPLAVLFYLPVLFTQARYPRFYAWVFAVFCLMLIAYYLLLTEGPSAASPQGLIIQAVGQKIISYASIISIGILSLGAYHHLAT